jgi:O-antigen/teichoic acid export membrane protein
MSDTSQKQINETLRELVRDDYIDCAGTIFELLMPFVGQLIVARYLSVENLGLKRLALNMVSFKSIFGALRMGAGVSRFVPRHTKSEKTHCVCFRLSDFVRHTVVTMVLIVLFADILANRVVNEPNTAMFFIK